MRHLATSPLQNIRRIESELLTEEFQAGTFFFSPQHMQHFSLWVSSSIIWHKSRASKWQRQVDRKYICNVPLTADTHHLSQETRCTHLRQRATHKWEYEQEWQNWWKYNARCKSQRHKNWLTRRELRNQTTSQTALLFLTDANLLNFKKHSLRFVPSQYQYPVSTWSLWH